MKSLTDHEAYCLAHQLMQRLFDVETESNGFSDTRQVLIYRVDGQEIGKSEGGKTTMTPLFNELCTKRMAEIFNQRTF